MASVIMGESFGQRPPPLYKMIQNILRDYPSGQIFKEVIQNADDARATEVKFFLDCRQRHTLPHTLGGTCLSNKQKDQYSSPALLSYNNAPFKKEDWESIQSLYVSGKATNPHKVGKFGIGFNSVYHITDIPVILSQGYCGFLDPQERIWRDADSSRGESGRGFYLRELSKKCPEVLDQFHNLCGFSKTDLLFANKTLLRFPLRTKKSKLSNDVYTINKLRELLEPLKEEVQFLLVYLRSVCSIEISQIEIDGSITSILKVSIDQLDIAHQRQQLVQSVETTFSGSSPYSVRRVLTDVCHFNVTLEINSLCHGQYNWLVVNQIGSEDNEVLELAKKQHVLPWVGTAIEMSQQPNDSSGRIFCVLPLPVEDRAPFCVHVNGTFAVSSNRRSLKWEVQERRGDEEGTWNKLLVSKCLPSCYVKLVSELMALNQRGPTLVYSCWPDIQQVNNTSWSGLLQSFYTLLLQSNTVVHTPLRNGQWISVNNSVFITNIPQAVNDALLQCNISLVEVNDNCTTALKQYYNGIIHELSPLIAKYHLKHYPNSYVHMSRENKIAILQYCLSDGSYSDIIGLQLLPLANGTFGQFQQKICPQSFSVISEVYLCTSDNPSTLLPGLENILVNEHNDDDSTLLSDLQSVGESGHTQLTFLGVTQVANLVSRCDTTTWSDTQMSNFWHWLGRQKRLDEFHGKPIVPVKLPCKTSSVAPLNKQGGVVYIPPYHFDSNSAVITGLQRCGVKFADSNEFTYLTHRQLQQYLYQLKPDDVLDAIQSNNSLANVDFTQPEAEALQNFFSSVTFNHSSRLLTICDLPLFCTLQGSGIISVQYSINSMKMVTNSYKAIAMKGSYDFRTDLLPLTPLVIDTSKNNLKLLMKLQSSSCVTFLTDINYLQKIAFPLIKNKRFLLTNVIPFMKSVLDNFRKYQLTCPEFASILRNLPFIEVESGSPLQAPCDLLDPEDKLLQVLFLGSNKFPGSQYDSYLSILKQCGLRSLVTAVELFEIVTSVQYLQRRKSLVTVDKITFVKMQTFFKYLKLHPNLLNEHINTNTLLKMALKDLNQKGNLFWLPIKDSSPDKYPSCLPWKGSQYTLTLASTNYTPIVALSEEINTSYLPMIFGSQALFIENVPSDLVTYVNSFPGDLVKAVLTHFQLVIDTVSNRDILQKLSIQTYKYLSENISFCSEDMLKEKWIWMENKSKFVKSKHVVIESDPTFRTSLEPFLYYLPASLSKFADLFIKCGVAREVTISQLVTVLESIKETPHSLTDEISARGVWSIVKAILEWLVEDETRLSEAGDVLVPVESVSKWPQLFPSSEVAYTDNDMLREIARASVEEEYHLVHPKVSHLSSSLGLTPLSDRLDITEEVFEDAGQHEPLVTRLANILREYKDGLTIIKEMIQNADDAGATEVNILYDNRTHPTQKLLFKGMAQCHGPALIVHNNSTFTEEDFENITKLAGATKANQPLKIGKFGVGFCSVYHITDVPSFVSGEWLYIFDPTLQYLKGIVRNENRPGKKVKYQSKFFSNSKQLLPYEGLFNFTSSSTYNGTMFRLPFRTNGSQISPTIYNDQMIAQLQQELKANGSKLLLFLQSVKKITFSCMNGNKEVKKLSIECHINGDIRKCVINSSAEYWLVSCIEKGVASEGILKPITTSVACRLAKKNKYFHCQPINGAAFCFLPLAVPNTGLPVHVSANFAVMSNRSGIWTDSSEGVASDSREAWNQQLMETVIPKAFCNLLLKLKEMALSGEITSYNFHSLWPLELDLQMKHPWDKLITALYKLISQETLFHSVSTNQWLTLDQSQFLHPSLFRSYISLKTLNDAVNKLKFPVVSLSDELLQQLNMSVSVGVHICTEYQFFVHFFRNIELLNDCLILRNEILSGLHSQVFIELSRSSFVMTTGSESLYDMLKTNCCVPCSPNGTVLELASNLVDPNKFQDIFDPEDGKFPLDSFCSNNLIREVMFKLGLLSNSLPWSMIVYSAKSVKPLFTKNRKKALSRIAAIIKLIKKNQSPPPSELKEIPFLPVLQKPNKYLLEWKGENQYLLPPSQVIAAVSDSDMNNLALIVGSQLAIVNTSAISNGGCGKIHEKVIEVLGISSHAFVDYVLSHFQLLINHLQTTSYKNSGILNYVTSICRSVYMFLTKELQNNSSRDVITRIAFFKDKKFVWTGNVFVTATNVARNWKLNGPYLYKLPDILSEQYALLKVLKICNDFDIQKLLNTLLYLYGQHGGERPLPKECQKFIDCLVSELNSANGEFLKDGHQIILIDNNYVLRPASELVYNDAQWLPVSDKCHLIHKIFSREKALDLGVKTVRYRCLDGYVNDLAFAGVEFGQREELTQRIKNILRDYPLDETFLKELLQNADDAKATKMTVILDKRQHGRKKLPSKEWEELQGPAVLVWNDKDFSEKDLEGIQKLGLGSKRHDDESIGQFGIGFNVVYHLTDCPSFVTRGGSTLCVFDPHCKYVPGANLIHPGRQYDNLGKEFWTNFEDLCSCYLQNPLPDQPNYLQKQQGSLFRFPLRSKKELVDASKLLDSEEVDSVLTSDVMDKKLTEWVDKIEEALLFLNHILQFEFYVIEDKDLHPKFQLRSSYSVSMCEDTIKTLKEFQRHQANFKKSYTPKVVTYSLTLSSNKKHASTLIRSTRGQHVSPIQREWIVQQGLGDLANPNQTWKYKQVLPKYGIAVPLKKPSFFSGKIFCFLPLSVSSQLPVHINGQFVLSSNRRSLWVSGDDENSDKVKWNTQLIEAISSAYVHFLLEVRDYIVKKEGYTNLRELEKSISWYYELFPYWKPKFTVDTSKSTGQLQSSKRHLTGTLEAEWLSLAKLVFQKIKSQNLPILATEIVAQNLTKANWHILCNNERPFCQVYFKPIKEKDIIGTLKKIGMSLTCAPHILHEHIEDLTPIATPSKVFDFYSKFHTEILNHPCPLQIACTPFETEAIFVKFLKYLLIQEKDSTSHVFPKLPANIPLLLTADGCIRYFHDVFSSEYADVFPKSASIFLHPIMLHLQMSTSYFVHNVQYTNIHKIFSDNFPLELNNYEANNHSWNFINEAKLKHLWNCISKDRIFLNHQSLILQNWALLPSTNGYLYQSRSSILPICQPENVSYQHVFQLICGTLGIPALNTTIHENTFVYCPDLSDYDKISQIVYSQHKQKNVLDSVTLEKTQIDILLDYLSKTTFRYNEDIKHQIKCLPIFLTVQKVLTSLLGKTVYLWPSNHFCIAGYEKWALLDNIVFLEREGSWKKLCGSDFSLIGEDPDELHIYSKLIFPNFHKLTPAERMKHLEYIRDFLFNDACHDSKKDHQSGLIAAQFLSDLLCLKCLPYQDKLLTVASFCDHTIEIFTTFSEHFCFLSKEYSDESWLKFFRKLNLQTTVQFDMFVTLARKVSKGSHDNLEKASGVLLIYLFSLKAKQWHSNKYMMHQIGDISFVKAAKLHRYSWIKAPCSPPNSFLSVGLTKLNEAVTYSCASLVWTVKPVVNLPEKVPSSMMENNSIQYLGVCTSPGVKDVYDNIINISRTGLAGINLFSTYDPQYHQLKDRANLVDVIIHNISYLQMKNATELLENLTEVSCVPVSAELPQPQYIVKPVLVKPIQVVLLLESKDVIDFTPFIHKPPQSLYSKLDLSLIGVCENLELKHIQFLLEMMQSNYPEGIIQGPNEVITIRKAINKLRNLLHDTFLRKHEIESQLQNLYLPTQVDHLTWKLVSTNNLIFSDTLRFDLKQFDFCTSMYSLFKIPPDHSNKALTRKTQEKDFCQMLPKGVRPRGLSLCSTEHVLVHNEVDKSPLKSHFKKLKELSDKMSKIMTPMIKSSQLDDKSAKEFTIHFLDILNKMTVIPINDLRVNIQLMNDCSIIGTSNVDYSLQKDKNHCHFTMYVNEETTPSPNLWNDIAQSFCIEVGRLLKVNPLQFFQHRETLSKLLAVQKVNELESICHQDLQDEDSVSNDDLTPKIGKSVPPQLVAILSQDINHIYRPQELVGYSINEDQYVWAMVLHVVVGKEDSRETQLKRYAIAYTENEAQPHIVSVVDLYKFIAQEHIKKSEETALVLSQDTSSANVFLCDARTNQKLLELKKKICKELRLIWASDLTQDEKTRAIRRMYLNYHPDRVSHDKDLYEEAFKYLLRQIDRLENGLPLEEPEDERDEEPACEHSRWHECYESWSYALRKTVYRFNEGGEGSGICFTGLGLNHVVAKPDPEEANRWMRQANSDLEAMKILCNHTQKRPVSCQVIFLAHEVMEKSLKAGMYALIGINPNSESLRSHNLTSHAYAILSQRPGQLEELPKLTASMEDSYLDTRFPNRHNKPNAPVDIYEPHQAHLASDIAKKIYQLINRVIQGEL